METKEKTIAQHIYETIDMIMGIVMEKGWDELERYSKTPQETFLGLFDILEEQDDPVLFKKAVDNATNYGMLK